MKTNNIELHSALGTTIGIGATATLMGLLMGGMNKMFGLNDDKTNLKEMTSGIVQGFLEHFEFKIDELNKQNKEFAKNLDEMTKERNHWEGKCQSLIEEMNKRKK